MSVTARAKAGAKLAAVGVGVLVAAALVITEPHWTVHAITGGVHYAGHGIASAWHWATGIAHDTSNT